MVWRHTLNTSSGEMELEVQTLWSFGAREQTGAVSLCTG